MCVYVCFTLGGSAAHGAVGSVGRVAVIAVQRTHRHAGVASVRRENGARRQLADQREHLVVILLSIITYTYTHRDIYIT